MKKAMKIVAACLGLATAFAVSATALAGYKSGSEVVMTATYAYGDVGAVRNSTDSNQYIGCGISAYNSGGAASGACYARTSAGVYRSCQVSASTPEQVKVIMGINSDSQIFFMWDANGVCTYVGSETRSYSPPKAL
jgi:hypothetical protein